MSKTSALDPKASCSHNAQRLLGESLDQFFECLQAIPSSEAPELIRQARRAWRRYRVLWHLFQPVDTLGTPWADLSPLLKLLGLVRDLDVARLETLPLRLKAAPLSPAYLWAQQALQQLSDSARLQLIDQIATLQPPKLHHLTHWLAALQIKPQHPKSWASASARKWVDALTRSYEEAQIQPFSAKRWHLVRLRAKRLRYGIEVLKPLLPHHLAAPWHHSAHQLQIRLGRERDALRLTELLQCTACPPKRPPDSPPPPSCS